MSDLAQFNQIVDSIYQGPKEVSPWSTFLSLFKEATGSVYAVLSFGEQASCKSHNQYITSDISIVDTRTRGGDYITASPFSYLPENQVATYADFSNGSLPHKSDLYQRFMAPLDTQDLIGANFIQRDNRLAYFRLAKNKGMGKYKESQRELCRLIIPHFQRVVDQLEEKSTDNLYKNILFDAMQFLGMGVIVLAEDRSVLNLNDLAAQTAQNSQEISFANGLMRFRNQEDNLLLDNAIHTLNQKPGQSQSFAINDINAGETLQFCCHEMKNQSLLNAHSQKYIIYMSSSAQQRNINISTLQQLFGFTPAEAKIALALVGGSSVNQYAAAQGVSQNTAYTHLKSAFSKADVHQQSMLVSRILGSVASLGRCH